MYRLELRETIFECDGTYVCIIDKDPFDDSAPEPISVPLDELQLFVWDNIQRNFETLRVDQKQKERNDEEERN